LFEGTIVKRLLLGLSLVACSGAAALANETAPTAHASPHPAVVPPVHHLTYRVAPADEYFGRLKMSILGIGNTIKDDGLKVDADPAQAPSTLSGVVLVEDALHDWEKKYPQDTWIPRSLFRLERLYAKIDSDAARAKAKATMMWLVHDFPASPQAKIGKTELAANRVGVRPAVVAAPADVPAPVVDAAAPANH
jgi:hypothetical protein